MFGLSWGQIAIIVLVGVFVLGPERIPTAVTWVLTNLRKLRSMAAGAQAELRKEIGPELEELRRQVADLQSLKEIQELRDLRDLHPKRLIGKNILGDEFSGGITGFLGLNQPPASAMDAAEPPVGGSSNGADSSFSSSNGNSGTGDSSNGNSGTGESSTISSPVAAAETVAPTGSSALNGGGVRSNGGATSVGPLRNGRETSAILSSAAAGRPNGSTPPHLPPSMTKLAAPKVVGGVAPRAAAAARPAGDRPTPPRPVGGSSNDERPPFDPDGT